MRRFAAHLELRPEFGELFVPRAALWTSAHTYLEPDLMFVSAEILQRTDPGHLMTASLVVEVISPSTAIYDRTTKADTYYAVGDTVMAVQLPGFRCEGKAVFI